MSLIDYIVVSGKKSMLEFAENKRHRGYQKYPAEVRDAHYVTPRTPGYSIGYQNGCLERFEWPVGTCWANEEGRERMDAGRLGKL